jgi:hypothetical protein
MDKLDQKKALKELYAPKREPTVVEVPALGSFAIDGAGDPNRGTRFQDCCEALYAASYSLKFALKKERGLDWAVMPPEGEWWCDDIGRFSLDRRDEWKWTIHIVQPDFVGKKEFELAVSLALEKKGLAALGELRFERSKACRAVTLMHVGPYSEEPGNIERIHSFIEGHGWKFSGRHREIYLSDPRKTAPEKMKTVLRQPFSR